jgi:hypothetical protein
MQRVDYDEENSRGARGATNARSDGGNPNTAFVSNARSDVS